MWIVVIAAVFIVVGVERIAAEFGAVLLSPTFVQFVSFGVDLLSILAGVGLLLRRRGSLALGTAVQALSAVFAAAALWGLALSLLSMAVSAAYFSTSFDYTAFVTTGAAIATALAVAFVAVVAGIERNAKGIAAASAAVTRRARVPVRIIAMIGAVEEVLMTGFFSRLNPAALLPSAASFGMVLLYAIFIPMLVFVFWAYEVLRTSVAVEEY